MKHTTILAAAVLALGIAAPALSIDVGGPGEGYIDRDEVERAFARTGFDYDEDADDVAVHDRATDTYLVECSNRSSYLVHVATIYDLYVDAEPEGLYLDGYNDELGSRGSVPAIGDPCGPRRNRGTVEDVWYWGGSSELTAIWNGIQKGISDDFMQPT